VQQTGNRELGNDFRQKGWRDVLCLRYLAGGSTLVPIDAGQMEYGANSIVGLACNLHGVLSCNKGKFCPLYRFYCAKPYNASDVGHG
jgi:hypothetical protein